jgi:YD repeat-containing protein
VVAQTDADQRLTTLSYDGDNRLGQSVAFTNGTTLTTTVGYDPDGNALTQTVQTQMGTGPVSTRVSTTTVNAADWPTSTGDGPATGAPLVTAYQYDGAGQQRSQSVLTTTLPVTSVLNGDGLATALGESVNSAQPYTSTFGYAPTDLPVTATLPGGTGVQEGRGYDGANRLLTLTLSGPPTATTVLSNTYLYAYNPASWTSAITSVVSGMTTMQVLTHDLQGRLTGVQSGGSTQSWSYDGNGNLLSATSPGASTSYSYQPSVTPNQLLSTTTGGITTFYGYDQNGDTTAITNSAQTLNTGVSYDAQARPITVTLQGGITATMSYNGVARIIGTENRSKADRLPAALEARGHHADPPPPHHRSIQGTRGWRP